MFRDSEVCFVHLGKYGDIMIMLPAFKAVADELGKPVICVVSKEFSGLLDGVSYVTPWEVDFHWWKGVKQARKMAEKAGFKPIVPKWWDEPGASPSISVAEGKSVTLKIHGETRVIPEKEWDSYQSSQWRYAGFTLQQMFEWPLVFDRRDPEREQELFRKHVNLSRPFILVNLSQGGTSPFKAAQQVRSLLYGHGLQIVNLASVRAHRIYDLLGLYERASMLITSDTATLHLASASKVPYIAFINNGGSGSIPRGNCILSIRYGQVTQNIGRIIQELKKLEPAPESFPKIVCHA